MRNISFALTKRQIRNQTKTVTRRVGWSWLKPGTLLQPVEKSQGLKKGERVKRVGAPIRVTSVRRERLSALLRKEPYGSMEVQREGFGGEMTPGVFVWFFAESHDCSEDAFVTRIEFEYTEPAR
jgi:hypothetical protein